MNMIRLKWTPDGWLACWLGPHAWSVAQLFGTNELPTGFTAKAEASMVLSEVSRLNPDVIVLLG